MGLIRLVEGVVWEGLYAREVGKDGVDGCHALDRKWFGGLCLV